MVRSSLVIISSWISVYGEIRWIHLFMSSSVCKKERGYEKREITIAGQWESASKMMKFDFCQYSISSFRISQSFILGRSYSNLSGLGPPFSDLTKSGAPGERGLAITAQQQGRTYLVRTAGISVICFFFCVGTLIDLCIFDGTDIGVWQIFFLTLTLSSLTSSPRSSFHTLNPRPSDYDLTQHQISETA